MVHWLRRNFDNITSNLLSSAIWVVGAAVLMAAVGGLVVAWSIIDDLPGPVIVVLALFAVGTVVWVIVAILAVIAHFRRPKVVGGGGELPLAERLKQGNALLGNGEPEIYATWAEATADGIQAEYGGAKRDWFLAGADGFLEDGMLEMVNRLATLLDEDGDRNEHVEFYPDRPSMIAARGGLNNELKDVHIAWAAWFAGTHATNENTFKVTHNPRKVVLLKPDGLAAHSAAALFDQTFEQFQNNVKATISKALESKVEVYLVDGPITLMLIAEPEARGGHGWVRIEIPIPGSSVRPNIVFQEADFPELFHDFVEGFKAMMHHYMTERLS